MNTIMQLLQITVDGIMIGGTYALLAAGLSLIFGVLKIINFAQAAFMMVAMYLTFVLLGVGLPFILVGAFVPIIMFFVGQQSYLAFLKRISRHRGEAQVLTTLGLSIVIEYAAQLIFSSTPRNINLPAASGIIEVSGVIIFYGQLFSFLTAIVIAFLIYQLMTATRFGLILRCCAEDEVWSTYAGIDVQRVKSIAFGFGVALSALGGVLLTLQRPIDPFVGHEFIIIMFVAVTMGGLGSIAGAFIGGILLGLIQSWSAYLLPAELAPAVMFVMFILLLIVKPQGLFSKSVRQV